MTSSGDYRNSYREKALGQLDCGRTKVPLQVLGLARRVLIDAAAR